MTLIKEALEKAAKKAEAAISLKDVDGGKDLDLLPTLIRDLYRLHYENNDQRYYWYVTFSYGGNNSYGQGSYSFKTDSPEFSIKASRELIKKQFKITNVVLCGWVLISKAQFDEYNTP